MRNFESQKIKLSRKLSRAVASERPLRALAQVAREAMTEANELTNTLTVEKIAVSLKRLPKQLDGFRIVQLSDLHHSPFTSLEFINESIKIANELAPEMFVLTGDFVSHDTEYIAPVADSLSHLKSEFGSFACLGNHDHWTDAELVTDLLRGEGIKVLVNEGFRFEARDASFWLCGVDDLTLAKTDIKAALKGAREDEMKLLLAHNPKILYRAARRGVDLMLSGHTHGGQVKLRDEEDKILPTRRLSSGLYRRKNTQVYITRGIGTVVVPLRYHCPPEITLIELRVAN